MAQIDLLLLANHAEVQNGLLYTMGAGWDTVNRAYDPAGQPEPFRFSLALGVVVPWSETNVAHPVNVWIEDEDGRRLVNSRFDLEVGRPPGRPPGSDTRTVMASSLTVQFPHAGGYRVVAEINGLSETRRVYSFRVVDHAKGPGAQAPPTTGDVG